MDSEQNNSEDAILEDEQEGISGQTGPNPYVIPGAIVLAGAMIAGAIAITNAPKDFGANPRVAAVRDSAPAVIDASALAENDPFLGSPTAPVTVVEFADFQCPFCGKFFKTAGKEIIEKYVKAGKVKFVYRDFAFLGAESEWAASAAECANEQGKFWQYHDHLYTHQNGENEGAFAKENLKHFALELGLDTTAFNTCLDSDKYIAEVRKDTEDGQRFGVSGTPTNFINGRLLVGARSFAEFAAMIEEELAKVK